MNDSYLGMDQQYDIYLDVIAASIAAQVNTEVSDAMSDLAVAWIFTGLVPNKPGAATSQHRLCWGAGAAVKITWYLP